jgi:predicted dehydrogenase
MTDAPLRVALLGYGLAGRAFHAPLLAAAAGIRLTTVVTANPARRAQAEADHPGVRIVESADHIWAAPDDHDLVVVATPNDVHVTLATAALHAGLHVVVDKPLAVDAASAQQLCERAVAAGRLLTVFQNRRWDGDVLTLRRLLAAGALGEVRRFESRFERWRPEPKSWRERSTPAEGGGLLLDLGSHLVDQALWLFGPAASVYAEVETRRPGVLADDDVFVAIRHTGGVTSHLWMSAVAAALGPRLRVLGSERSYVKYEADVQEAQLRSGLAPDDPAYGAEPPEAFGVLGVGDLVEPVPTERGDYGAFYTGVMAAVRDGSPPPVDPADAVATLRVLDAARRSATDGSVVRLSAGA